MAIDWRSWFGLSDSKPSKSAVYIEDGKYYTSLGAKMCVCQHGDNYHISIGCTYNYPSCWCRGFQHARVMNASS